MSDTNSVLIPGEKKTHTDTASQTDYRAIVCGPWGLAEAVSQELAKRGATVGLSTHCSDQEFQQLCQSLDKPGDVRRLPEAVTCLPQDEFVTGAANELGGLTTLINLFGPDPRGDLAKVNAYPQQLLQRCLAAAELMGQGNAPRAIVNHCFLPAMYVGTALQDYLPTLKGAITGVTRTLACKLGRQGVRVSCVQTGLIEMPETEQWASEKVRQVKVPMKRWGTPRDVAKLVTFLAFDNRYITGQTLILDGGLTAGITGT